MKFSINDTLDLNQRRRVEMLFEQAADLPESEWPVFLESHCADDPLVRAGLMTLLLHDKEGSDDFFERPALVEPEAMGEQIGQRIGHYELLSIIGEGGFGTVYLARQHEPVDRRVALKILKLGMDTRAVVRRFRAEQQTLAMMEHPHLARVLDAGVTDRGRPYFAMDYVPGQPLTAYCESRQLSIRDRLQLFLQVCQAVHHAHQKGIIHRDLKPTNVLVEEVDGRPAAKVIDFGIAKAIHEKSDGATLASQPGTLVGTPAYMSPEQATAGSGQLDIRTDVYSLGVMLYQLLTGVLPFDPRRLGSVSFSEMERILRDETPLRPSSRILRHRESGVDQADAPRSAVRLLRRQLAGDLDWIVMKAMDKQPDRRYAAVSELAADISRHLRHEPVLAGPPDPVYRAQVRRAAPHRRAGGIGGDAGPGRGRHRDHHRDVPGDRSGARRPPPGEKEPQARLEAEQAQHLAETEVRKSDAVLGFLTRTFSAADPNNTQGSEPTVREVLDRAAGELSRSLAGQPLVEAHVGRVFGQIYANLGRYSEAVAFLRRSVDLLERHAPAQEGNIAVNCMTLSVALQRDRRYGEALVWARHGQRLLLENRKRGEPPPLALVTLGSVLLEMQRFGEAEALLVEFYERGRDELAENDAGLQNAMSYLTALFNAQGRLHEALPLVRSHLGYARRRHGERHYSTLRTLNNLATLLKKLDRREEAESLFLQCMAAYEQMFGPEHPDLLSVKTNYAGMLVHMNRLAEARAILESTLAITRRTRGEEDPTTLSQRNDLAEILAARGELEQAERLHRDVLQIRAKRLGPSHLATLSSMYNLGYVLMDQKKYSGALALFSKAEDASRAGLPPGHWYVAMFQFARGRCLAQLERFSEAEPLLLSSFEALNASHGLHSGRTQNVVRALHELYTGWDRPEEAERWALRLNAPSR